jgi:hypothetical protein
MGADRRRAENPFFSLKPINSKLKFFHLRVVALQGETKPTDHFCIVGNSAGKKPAAQARRNSFGRWRNCASVRDDNSMLLEENGFRAICCFRYFRTDFEISFMLQRHPDERVNWDLWNQDTFWSNCRNTFQIRGA